MAKDKQAPALVAACPICVDGVSYAAGDKLVDVSEGTLSSMIRMGQAVDADAFAAELEEQRKRDAEAIAAREAAKRKPAEPAG